MLEYAHHPRVICQVHWPCLWVHTIVVTICQHTFVCVLKHQTIQCLVIKETNLKGNLTLGVDFFKNDLGYCQWRFGLEIYNRNHKKGSSLNKDYIKCIKNSARCYAAH